MIEINERDQLFRPMYDTHDDTIEANREANLERIVELAEQQGFPAHQELGYSKFLRGQKHLIALHHTAQRRSRDKSVPDLRPLLREAVDGGRMDPETEILYLNFQNDPGTGPYEVYSSWQYRHPLLPDSLNNKVWLINLSEEGQQKADSGRREWHANSLEEIAAKTDFLPKSELPFIFSGISKSIGNFSEDQSREKALEQYRYAANNLREYDNSK